MNQPTDQWNARLVTIITSRLDVAAVQGWQLSCYSIELLKYKGIEKFLVDRCSEIEISEAWLSDTSEVKLLTLKRSGTNSNLKKILAAVESKPHRACICCGELHKLYTCKRFKGI